MEKSDKLKSLGEMQTLVLPRSNRRFNPALLYQVCCDTKSTADPNAYAHYKKSVMEAYKDDKTNIPKAKYRECEPILMSPMKTCSELYVHHEMTAEELDQAVEYESDDLDVLWLKAINKAKKHNLTMDVIVQVINRLEKDSIFQPRKSMGVFNSTDDVCCICGSEEDEDLNKIIYCDMCNIAVHQECYGVPFIPEGPWYCRKCKLSPSAQVTCSVCPSQDGAFKTTSDHRWIHVICTIWLNELHFLNTVFLDPVEGVDKCLQLRAKLICMICKKKVGACVQCSYRNCSRSFHVTCAQAANVYMREEANEDSDASDKMNVQRYIYCYLHDPNVKETDRVLRKKKMWDTYKAVQKQLKKKKSIVLPVITPSISSEKVDAIAKRFNCNQVIKDIVDYWILKRKQRLGVPLIARLQEEIESKSAQQESNLLEDPAAEELRRKYSVLRSDLERQRLLWELVKKREFYKKEHWLTTSQAFELIFMAPDVILSQLLNELEQHDRKKIFIEPVENTVAAYRTVITKPMDFQTMKGKLTNKKYSTIGEIRKDWELMCSNCERYNTTFDNRFYVEYAERFRKKCLPIFEKWEKHMDFHNSYTKNNIKSLGETLLKLSFYEKEFSTERIKENAPIGENDMVPLVNGNIFLQQGKMNYGLLTRKRTNDMSTMPIKRRKTQGNEDSGLHQTSMTQFISKRCASPPQVPAAIDGRRSRQKQKPLTDFRQNPVQSPLAADVASCTEYSTEEDEKLTTDTVRDSLIKNGRLRSSRLGPIQQSRTSDTDLGHNDIVYIKQHGSNKVIGRVLDPRCVGIDDLPQSVIAKVREGAKNNDVIHVLLFGDQTCSSYSASSLQPVDFDAVPHQLLRTKQFKLAQEFKNKIGNPNLVMSK